MATANFASIAGVKALAAKQLAKAEETLNRLDKRAEERIVQVKAIAGLTAPAPVADAVTDAGVSSAVASLLLPEERGVADEEEAALGSMPPLPQSSPDQGGTSAARSEWLALQQELQIVSMHGRRLQARLEKQRVAKEQLESHVAALSLSEAQRVAELAAAGAARDAATSRAEAAEATAAAARDEVLRLGRQLAQQGEALARAKSGYGAQADGLAALREQQRDTERAAAQVEQLTAERLRAAEAREAELLRLNAELTSALAAASRADALPRRAASADPGVAELRRQAAAEAAARRDAEADAAAVRAELATAVAALGAARREAEAAEERRETLQARLAEATAAAEAEKRAAAAAANAADGGVVASGVAAPHEGFGSAVERSKARAEVESLTEERAALRLRLEAEASRRRALERSLALRAAAAPGEAVRIDVPAARGRSRGARVVQPWLEAQASRAQQLAPPPAVAVAAAVDEVLVLLDRAACLVGRPLRAFALARCAAVTYALLLHGWLFLAPFASLLALPMTRAHAHS